MIFEQSWFYLGKAVDPVTAAEIEAEPMLFNASLDEALTHGGPITEQFVLRALVARAFLEGQRVSIDTRCHMLMRGWYPAIPGWHHDDVDRGASGQPDYDDAGTSPGRRMFSAVLDASDAPTGAMTEFFQPGQRVSVPWPVPEDLPVYRYWDAHIEREVTATRCAVRSGEIVAFGQGDFHRAMPAKASGWRWFARLTVNQGPRSAPFKVRRQSQVYLPVTNQGW